MSDAALEIGADLVAGIAAQAKGEDAQKCLPYGGNCANGTLKPQEERVRANDCATCDEGYQTVTKAKLATECREWKGECANGELLPLAERSADDQCGSCDAGHHLKARACIAWAGTCENGALQIGRASCRERV